MWPFKKKIQKADPTDDIFHSVICIPGNWESRKEFILSIITANAKEYMTAGNILMNLESKTHCTIEFCELDERMKKTFKNAGMVTRVTDGFLDEIEKHKNVVYISGATGGLKEAEDFAKAGAAVLKAGGLGIKVETAGKAFEKDQWLNMVDNFKIANLYTMFVVDSIVDKEGTVNSCGMHNLGLPDTVISDEEFQEAVHLISVFNFYQIIDKPSVQNNQSFRVDMQSPVYRITEELEQPYKEQALFQNPFGMWRLSKE